MAENENGAEKSEEPTAKRKQQAREKGEIARSRELNTLAILLGGTGGMLMFGAGLGIKILEIMQQNFDLPRELLYSERHMALHLLYAAKTAAEGIWPLFLILLLAAVIGPVALGGFLFTMEPLTPKFSRLNPLSGLKRMFSVKSLVELVKSLAKFLVVLMVALFVLARAQDGLFALAHQPLEYAILSAIQTIGWCSLWLACAMILIAAVDVPFQMWDSNQKLKMTKQEVKDEYKDSEGKPEVKGRIRRMQMEMAQRRMMESVPDADVVITNPTHFSVALKYDEQGNRAPVLLAKGSDHLALKIREIAGQHQIIVLESPPLARALYYSTELDEEIPGGLYMAVAQVLAYVYQLRQFHAGKGKRPKPLGDMPIPEDLRRDE
ncbi:MAG: flagellar biosynthesis protein FlhB [Gammaproteobacteria bacterium]|nr:flagellar biosynthesis protein FlhB [Gammaproteobacteria bacterium]